MKALKLIQINGKGLMLNLHSIKTNSYVKYLIAER